MPIAEPSVGGPATISSSSAAGSSPRSLTFVAGWCTIQRASARRPATDARSPNSRRRRCPSSRKRVSGGIAIRGCACSINCSIVVPDRGQPTTKIGRSFSIGPSVDVRSEQGMDVLSAM
jgi:hypothetical protein